MSPRRGTIQTVLGPIAPELLGPTLMHEHVLCDLTSPELAAQRLPAVEIRLDNLFEIRHQWCGHAGHHVLDDRDLAANELARFGALGGSAVVELTCEGMAPDPAGLAEVAQRSGLHIIAGSGPYVEAYLGPDERNRSVDETTAAMVRAVHEGFGESGVRAGILGEIGLSTPSTAVERRSLVAAAHAQQATGAAINVHPPRTLDGTMQAIATLRRVGGRYRARHREPCRPYLVQRRRHGACGRYRGGAEFDFFGIESSYYPFADVDLPNDGQRVRHIVDLVRRGHGCRIVVAHDICTRTRLRRFGGHGYGHLLENAVPLMRRRGLSDDDVAQIFVATRAGCSHSRERSVTGTETFSRHFASGMVRRSVHAAGGTLLYAARHHRQAPGRRRHPPAPGRLGPLRIQPPSAARHPVALRLATPGDETPRTAVGARPHADWRYRGDVRGTAHSAAGRRLRVVVCVTGPRRGHFALRVRRATQQVAIDRACAGILPGSWL